MFKKINKEKIIFGLLIIGVLVCVYILTNSIMIKNREGVILSFSFFAFCIWLFHVEKIDKNKDLFRKIAWISEREYYGSMDSVDFRNDELVDYIEIEQRILNIPEQFRIDFSNKIEKEILIKILNDHKEHVLRKYFSGSLVMSKDIYCLDDLEYYFFSLECFVFNNLYNWKSELFDSREYISDYKFKCQLNEYGRAYYKLELITRLYVENNEKIQKLFNNYDKKRTNHIIEILEKNEASFFNYIP